MRAASNKDFVYETSASSCIHIKQQPGKSILLSTSFLTFCGSLKLFLSAQRSRFCKCHGMKAEIALCLQHGALCFGGMHMCCCCDWRRETAISARKYMPSPFYFLTATKTALAALAAGALAFATSGSPSLLYCQAQHYQPAARRAVCGKVKSHAAIRQNKSNASESVPEITAP